MTASGASPAPPEPPPGSWEAWVNRTSAILAVLAALSSGQWGASNLKAILEQGKVNDGWSYYQAKSIKGHAAENTARLAAALAADVAPGKKSPLQAFVAGMREEKDRYDKEKTEQFTECKNLELARDACVERSFWFEIAFVCLQVGVVLSTIAAAAKKKGIWLAAIVAGTLGLAVVANGFVSFMRAPTELAKKLGPKLDAPVPQKSGAPAAPTPSASAPGPQPGGGAEGGK